VPDQETDVATFDVSNITTLSVASSVAISGIVLNSGASAYTIAADFSIQGAGIINNSGVTQNFISAQEDIGFGGNATAGDDIVYTNNGEMPLAYGTVFAERANAGSATFINKEDSADLRLAFMLFRDTTSAANSTIINQSGDTYRAVTEFQDHASAGNSSITLEQGLRLISTTTQRAAPPHLSRMAGKFIL